MAGDARILVIDDQPYSRHLASSLLGRAHEVVAEASAAAAWERLEREGPVDLVVMDLVLPDADGLEILTRLRRRWPGQQVLVLSGVSDSRAAVAAMRAGARDYLIKPIDRDALPQAVESALREARASVPGTSPPKGSDSALERAVDLLSLEDRATIEHRLLEILCLAAGVGDALLWSVQDGAYALAAVHGDLPDEGTAPQRPTLSPAAESRLRGGEPCVEPREPGGPARLYVPCMHRGSLFAVACLLPAERQAPDAPRLAALVRIAGVGAQALAAAAGAGTGDRLREPGSGLLTRAFLDEIGQLEIHRAQRLGRHLCLVCVELAEGGDPALRAGPVVVSALQRTLRNTDVLASEGAGRYWVLVSDADPLGGIVLKRRLGRRLRAALHEAGVECGLALSAASYPGDGPRIDALRARALERLRRDREGLMATLAIDEDTPLATVGERLLERAMWLPASFVGEAAELVIGDVSARPRDRGLLLVAPGQDRRAVLEPLGALADVETGTEVFVATDGETLPVGPSVTALGLPPDVNPASTWILRLGEGPAYALIAGASRRDGARPVFHTTDAGLVEHLAFRLRAEIGFGVRG